MGKNAFIAQKNISEIYDTVTLQQIFRVARQDKGEDFELLGEVKVEKATWEK